MFKNQLCKTATIACIAGFLGSCGQPSPTAQNSPNEANATASGSTVLTQVVPTVVATTTILCDITKQIAAHTIDLTCPIKPASDPHIYEPTPKDRKALEEAKLVLYGGYNFEPSLIKIIKATSNAAHKIAVNEVAVPKPQTFEEDGKTEIDPHVWHNAQNGIRIVETIERNLAKVAPENAKLYAKNAQVMTKELAQIDTWIKAQVSTIPPASRKLVTTHDALGYYAKAYRIPVEGALEGISTDEKPTASRVVALVKIIQATKVPTIFAELTINPQLIKAVAKDAKVKVSDRELFADGLGEPGSNGATYQKMLISNTQTIVEGLGGKYKAFEAQK